MSSGRSATGRRPRARLAGSATEAPRPAGVLRNRIALEPPVVNAEVLATPALVAGVLTRVEEEVDARHANVARPHGAARPTLNPAIPADIIARCPLQKTFSSRSSVSPRRGRFPRASSDGLGASRSSRARVLAFSRRATAYTRSACRKCPYAISRLSCVEGRRTRWG